MPVKAAMAREQLRLNALDAAKMQWYHFMAIFVDMVILFTHIVLSFAKAYNLLFAKICHNMMSAKTTFFYCKAIVIMDVIILFYCTKSIVSDLRCFVLRPSLLAFRPIDCEYLDAKFSVKPASKGGNDNQIVYYSIDVLKCFSALQTLVPMVLYAAETWIKFSYSKTLTPKYVVSMFEKSLSSAPSKSSNAGAVSEFSSVEGFGKSNQPFVSVIDLSTLKKATITYSATPRARDRDTGYDSDKIRVTMNVESLRKSGNSASAIFSSSEATLNPMVNEFGETGLESYSDPDSGAVERGMEANTGATWIVATAAPHHATGNRDLLIDFTMEGDDIFVSTADGAPMQVLGRGNVVTDAVILPDVWYIPGLAANLVSVSQLGELDYSVGFGRSACYVRSNSNDAVVGEAHIREDGLFKLDFLKINLSM